MEKVIVWTNYFDAVKPEVERLLKEGKAVHVGADCIGHTRAYMIRSNAQKFFEEAGAVVLEDGYYYLESAQKPVPKKRGRKPKKERL